MSTVAPAAESSAANNDDWKAQQAERGRKCRDKYLRKIEQLRSTIDFDAYGPHARRMVKFSVSNYIKSYHYFTIQCEWAVFCELQRQTAVKARKKSCDVLTLATLYGGDTEDGAQSDQKNVIGFDIVGLDYDKGHYTHEKAEARCREFGLESVATESYSHLTTSMDLVWANRDEKGEWHLSDFGKFCDELGVDGHEAVTAEHCKAFLESDGYSLVALGDITLDGWTIEGDEEDLDAPMELRLAITHAPLPKIRIFLLLNEREERRQGETNNQFQKRYEQEIYSPIAQHFAPHFDKSCKTIERRWYWRGRRPDASPVAPVHVQGNLVDRTKLEPVKPERPSRPANDNGPRQAWHSELGGWHGFQAADAAADTFPDVKDKRDTDNPGVAVDCPFRSSHGGSKDGKLQLYVRNAPYHDRLPHVKCQSSTCQGKERTAEEYLEALFRDHPGINSVERYHKGSGGPLPLSNTSTSEADVTALIDAMTRDSDAAARDLAYASVARLASESAKSDARKLIKDKTAQSFKDIDAGLKAAEKELKASHAPKLESRQTRYDANGGLCIHDWNRADGGKFNEICNLVLKELLTSNAKDPRLFKMGNQVVRISLTSTGQHEAQKLTKDSLQQEINGVVHFTMSGGKTDPRDKMIACPIEIVTDILNRTVLPFLELVAITDTPYFAKSGELVETPGYHPESKTLYMPPVGFRLFKVPRSPTAKDIARALRILDQPLADVPFDDGDDLNAELGQGQASKANWYAKLVQAFTHDLIDGACPLYVGQKPKERTGATLLTNIHSQIAYGSPAKLQNQKESPAEYQKTIIALLKSGARHIPFDNIHGKIDDPTLATLATGTIYSGRELGSTKIVIAPIRCEVEFTGNNLTLSNELRERSVLIRLDARQPNPGDRDPSKFKYPDLLTRVAQKRCLFVWAVLVLVQSWIAAGRPQWKGKALGGFERACSVLGGVLDNAGVRGFLGNRGLLRESVGDDSAEPAAFVGMWWSQFKDDPITVGQLQAGDQPFEYVPGECAKTKTVATLCDLLLVNSERVNFGITGYSKGAWNRYLGRVLDEMKDQTFDLDDGTRLVVKKRSKQRDWYLQRAKRA